MNSETIPKKLENSKDSKNLRSPTAVPGNLRECRNLIKVQVCQSLIFKSTTTKASMITSKQQVSFQLSRHSSTKQVNNIKYKHFDCELKEATPRA